MKCMKSGETRYLMNTNKKVLWFSSLSAVCFWLFTTTFWWPQNSKSSSSSEWTTWNGRKIGVVMLIVMMCEHTAAESVWWYMICPEVSWLSFLSDVVIHITEGREGSKSTLKHFKHLFVNLLGPLLGIQSWNIIMIEFDHISDLTVIPCTCVLRPHLPTFYWWKYWSLAFIPFVEE
jgi:hypothetical protein